MGVKMNFVLSIVALIIAIVGCVLAVRLSFFQPAPLSEEKSKTYVTEGKEEEKEDNSKIVIPQPKPDDLPSY
ncbi:unnamed protein product [marine sediment metagenome]|uniref:Uncharacterized protein n=1 Tax=marine sediment metagenome TaxID=412755 RepID=X1M360_9ZZZZ